MPSHLPPLSEYCDRHTTQEIVEPYFPTENSFSWFVRQNRSKLAGNGALIMVAGRQMFHPPTIERTVTEIGRALALKSAQDREA